MNRFKHTIPLLFFIAALVSCASETFTSVNGEELEVSSLVGRSVFTVASEYSNDGPETLTGTNNDRWVVYYQDIDVTVETNKKTNVVQVATKGRNPKSGTFAD